jgi:hypothetical protein
MVLRESHLSCREAAMPHNQLVFGRNSRILYAAITLLFNRTVALCIFTIARLILLQLSADS